MDAIRKPAHALEPGARERFDSLGQLVVRQRVLHVGPYLFFIIHGKNLS